MKYDLTAILAFTFAAFLIHTSCMAPKKENMATLSMAEIEPLPQPQPDAPKDVSFFDRPMKVVKDMSEPIEFKEDMTPEETDKATEKLTALDDILRGACKKYKYFPSV